MKALGMPFTRAELKSTFSILDADDSKTLNYKEIFTQGKKDTKEALEPFPIKNGSLLERICLRSLKKGVETKGSEKKYGKGKKQGGNNSR